MITFERNIRQRLVLRFETWHIRFQILCIVASMYQGCSSAVYNVTVGCVSLTYKTCRLVHWEVLHLLICSDLRATQT